MARRGGVILDLIWAHVDATHNRFDQFITACREKVAARLPEATLSVNMRVDGVEAMVKVTAVPADIENLPGPVRNAVIRMYTEAELPLVRALVTNVAWTGPDV